MAGDYFCGRCGSWTPCRCGLDFLPRLSNLMDNINQSTIDAIKKLANDYNSGKMNKDIFINNIFNIIKVDLNVK